MDERSCRFDELTYLELRERADSGALITLPTGCTEQQGPHLPVGFDSWFAEELMLAAAQRAAASGVDALGLPVLPLGPTPEPRSYGSGYVHLPTTLHSAVIRSMLDSLAVQGFSRLIIWRGCGGHDLKQVVDEFNRSQEKAQAFLPQPFFGEIWCRLGPPGVAGSTPTVSLRP